MNTEYEHVRNNRYNTGSEEWLACHLTSITEILVLCRTYSWWWESPPLLVWDIRAHTVPLTKGSKWTALICT